MPQDMDCGGFFLAVLQLVETTESTGLATSDSAGGGVSAQFSVNTMKNLGYNPKVKMQVMAPCLPLALLPLSMPPTCIAVSRFVSL